MIIAIGGRYTKFVFMGPKFKNTGRLALSVGIVVALGTGAGIFYLQARAGRAYRAELLTTRISEHLNAMRIMELSGAPLMQLPTGREGLSQTEASIRSNIAELYNYYPGPVTSRLETSYNLYESVVDKDVSAIRAGQMERAGAGPKATQYLFDSLQQAHANADLYFTGLGARANRQARVGSAVFLLISVTTICLLLLKYRDEKQKLELEGAKQEALARSERRFRSLIQGSSDGILLLDRAGNVLYVSASAYKIFGDGSEALIGKNFSEAITGEDHDALQVLIAECLIEIKSVKQIRTGDPGGEHKHLEVTALNRTEDPDVGAIVLNCRDITEKIRLESVAEAANVMNNIGYIFSGIRHELGNPVNAIKVTLGVLDSRLESYSIGEIRKQTGLISRELARVEYLLKALKGFNIYENMDIREINIRSFLRDFMELVSDDLSRKSINISTEIAPDAVSVMADSRALQQVLINVLTNAMDAFKEEMPSNRIRIEVARTGMDAMISVSDNGAGMGRQALNDLFKPFFTSKPHGTGLGLVITRKMMLKMGGNIHIKSQLNQGTTVQMILPSGEACIRAQEAAAPGGMGPEA